jgi:hypothetical protein
VDRDEIVPDPPLIPALVLDEARPHHVLRKVPLEPARRLDDVIVDTRNHHLFPEHG